MCQFLLDLGKLFISSLTVGVVFAAIIYFFREKIKNLIQYTIKFKYDKKLEDYKTIELKRQKAILVAELLSEWISKPEDKKKLNQLTLEAFIWIPKETAIRLSQLLSHSPDAPNVRTIISEIRKLILGDEESIDENIIIIFPQSE